MPDIYGLTKNTFLFGSASKVRTVFIPFCSCANTVKKRGSRAGRFWYPCCTTGGDLQNGRTVPSREALVFRELSAMVTL
jgi:hypothetical protein